MLGLFTQSEARDELGVGQLRDAFSDLLFPGTSVLQTRARYFLVVPWLFTVGAGRHGSGPALRTWVEARERTLIETMRQDGHLEGLIGRVAGARVKLLPSTIYWSALARYGILRRDIAADRLGSAPPGPDGAEELPERRLGDWHPTLPPVPAGFPKRLDGGFDLTRVEADWLAERMRTVASDRLLGHMLAGRRTVDPSSTAPWDDATSADTPDGVTRVLEHAELFSLAMHGAALLYNLLVGEEYERAGLTRVEAPVDRLRGDLDQWSATCRAAADRLRGWDVDDLWQTVLGANPRIGVATRGFVDAWIAALRSGRANTVADDAALRRLVRTREQTQKRGQSRLANPLLLPTWSGQSGAGRLVYRWGTVRRLLADIQQGRAADALA